MIYEFQVLYEDASGTLRDTLVRAETPEQAMGMVDAVGRRKSQSVSPGRPVMDWNQPTYDIEEACRYLHCGTTKISDLMAKGKLPKARNGRPLFTRKQLDAVFQHEEAA